jgi:hypothetical protein
LNSFESFTGQIYTVNDQTFNNIALSLFRYQAANNAIYKEFITNLGVEVTEVNAIDQIPFLPISFFKSHSVKTGAWTAEVCFTSSGTTGMTTSKHEILSLDFYRKHAVRCFEHFFGSLRNYHFFALLPSYLERKDSSLVAMMQHFIAESGSGASGFYLYDLDKLIKDIKALPDDGKKAILWGVSFALLDLAEKSTLTFQNCMVFETGGMKGRRKEIIREELHEILKKGLGVNRLYSEYGMTELLSQAYMVDGRFFNPPPWMKIVGRDISDPLKKGLLSETCGINVIDLANWHSIAFIETEDLGKVNENGSFEVLGRMDNSEIRGCNLLVE